MKSLVIKRSIVIAGHKTSVSLEDAFWQTFKEIAALRRMALSQLAEVIDAEGRSNDVVRIRCGPTAAPRS